MKPWTLSMQSKQKVKLCWRLLPWYVDEDDLSLQTDLKHLHRERVCRCNASLCTQFPLCESANTYNPHCRSPTFIYFFCLPQTDTGKQRGQKLNPAASCIQWLNWWSIGQGQDAAAPCLNPSLWGHPDCSNHSMELITFLVLLVILQSGEWLPSN